MGERALDFPTVCGRKTGLGLAGHGCSRSEWRM